MLKFLVDESSGKKLSKFLLESGFDVKYVMDIMAGASDKDILEFAEREKRILITNDKDFGELIFRLSKPSSGVILLRLRNDMPKNRQRYVLNLIESIPNKLESSFIVVTEGKIRIREK